MPQHTGCDDAVAPLRRAPCYTLTTVGISKKRTSGCVFQGGPLLQQELFWGRSIVASDATKSLRSLFFFACDIAGCSSPFRLQSSPFVVGLGLCPEKRKLGVFQHNLDLSFVLLQVVKTHVQSSKFRVTL